MSIAKKVKVLLTEIVKSPSRPSYVLEHNGKQVVMRPGGNYANCDLAGFNFRDLDLKNANFQGANLEGANFSGAHLEGANFIDSNMHGARLSGAYLESAQIDIDSLAVADLESMPSGLTDEFIAELTHGRVL